MIGVADGINDAAANEASHHLADVGDAEMSNAILLHNNDPTAMDGEDPFNGITEGSTFLEKMAQKRTYDNEMFEIAKLKRQSKL